ncbi:hypothetical protein GN956_G25395 [Arapaima gigas]
MLLLRRRRRLLLRERADGHALRGGDATRLHEAGFVYRDTQPRPAERIPRNDARSMRGSVDGTTWAQPGDPTVVARPSAAFSKWSFNGSSRPVGKKT